MKSGVVLIKGEGVLVIHEPVAVIVSSGYENCPEFGPENI